MVFLVGQKPRDPAETPRDIFCTKDPQAPVTSIAVHIDNVDERSSGDPTLVDSWKSLAIYRPGRRKCTTQAVNCTLNKKVTLVP